MKPAFGVELILRKWLATRISGGGSAASFTDSTQPALSPRPSFDANGPSPFAQLAGSSTQFSHPRSAPSKPALTSDCAAAGTESANDIPATATLTKMPVLPLICLSRGCHRLRPLSTHCAHAAFRYRSRYERPTRPGRSGRMAVAVIRCELPVRRSNSRFERLEPLARESRARRGNQHVGDGTVGPGFRSHRNQDSLGRSCC